MATTRLGLYGGTRMPYGSFAGKTEGEVVAPSTKGGRSRRRRRYSVEVDGEFFAFDSIAEVEGFLAQVRETAEESAKRDVQTEIAPKPPKVTVKTGTGSPTTSTTLKRDIKRTQQAITRAYRNAAQAIARQGEVDREISRLLQQKLAAEDEEDSIIALLI